MRCVFKTLTIHNFLSFGDATIDLKDKGYCAISGRNKNPSDRAFSNGAGKSTIINAIAYCLFGTTINGIKSNIENIHTQGGCFVSLEFDLDDSEYVITRYKNHQVYKTDLKIFCNGDDISGKSITESNNILASKLPDLSLDLLTSVILLGQGLPNSFTKNTPAGRKELLEKLTKSDFMIQDVKERINSRITFINNQIDKDNLELAKLTTKVESDERRKSSIGLELTNLENTSYDFLIEKASQEEAILQTRQIELNKIVIEEENKVEGFNQKLLELNNVKQDKKEKELKPLFTKLNEEQNKLFEIRHKIDSLSQEINRLDSVKDTCPTCGQKLLNITKIDTTSMKIEVENIKRDYGLQEALVQNLKKEYTQKEEDIDNYINEESKEIRKNLDECKQLLLKTRNDKTNVDNQLISVSRDLASYQVKKETSLTRINELNKELSDIISELSTLNDKILYTNKDIDSFKEHYDIVNKMNTLVKRDFRGYLLINILNYINAKAKEYCKFIFNTDDLSIELNGNNIDVIFSGKDFDLLSGGEKQKVDLIIQFAIRDMMSKYLDFNSNVLFLDEITDNLDSVGCEGLLNLISNSLNDVESLFIISHHVDELALPTDSEIIVEKNSEGISSIVS